uniref:Uncharacterized protein n=1 Tax=Oryza nivara TaxID=4536 RepID=A0A0E0FYV6_ORYNI
MVSEKGPVSTEAVAAYNGLFSQPLPPDHAMTFSSLFSDSLPPAQARTDGQTLGCGFPVPVLCSPSCPCKMSSFYWLLLF